MNRILWAVACTLLIAGCGQQESEQATVEEPLAGQETVVEEMAEPQQPVADESTEEVIEVVEESASEPEPEEEAILLAQADAPVAPAEWKYREGQHYARLVPAQPTVGGADKVEVAEFFWYGCPHCYDLEPYINRWAAEAPANARFVRIPATWNNLLVLHAQLYYTEEILVRNGSIEDGAAFHAAVFEEYHGRGNRLASEAAIQRLFERFGVSADEFQRTWSSFEVAQKLRVAQDLMRRYGVAAVPTIVVNGKYRTGGAEAGSYPNLIELINELIVRESLR